VDITDITGLTITGDATPTLSAPTGSGTDIITFTLSTALTNGQSVTLSITSSNTIKDAANNALAATTKTITNNVAASYDVDYQEVLNLATANGVALPTATESDINNQIVLDLKASGVWSMIDCFYKYKGDATSAFKLIDWKRLSQGIGFGGLTWTSTGVKGNGTNAYINSTFKPAIDGINYTRDAAGVFFVNTLNIVETASLLGANSSANYGMGVIGNRSSNNNYWTLNTDMATTTFENVNSTVGANGLYRISATQQRLITNAYDNVQNNNSLALISEEVAILAQNDINDPVTPQVKLYSQEELSYLVIGGNMEAKHTNLKTILI